MTVDGYSEEGLGAANLVEVIGMEVEGGSDKGVGGRGVGCWHYNPQGY